MSWMDVLEQRVSVHVVPSVMRLVASLGSLNRVTCFLHYYREWLVEHIELEPKPDSPVEQRSSEAERWYGQMPPD